MEVQGRRKRGRPKRRWLDKVKNDINEKGMSGEEVYDHATYYRQASTPHKSGDKMNWKKKNCSLLSIVMKT